MMDHKREREEDSDSCYEDYHHTIKKFKTSESITGTLMLINYCSATRRRYDLV